MYLFLEVQVSATLNLVKAYINLLYFLYLYRNSSLIWHIVHYTGGPGELQEDVLQPAHKANARVSLYVSGQKFSNANCRE